MKFYIFACTVLVALLAWQATVLFSITPSRPSWSLALVAVGSAIFFLWQTLTTLQQSIIGRHTPVTFILTSISTVGIFILDFAILYTDHGLIDTDNHTVYDASSCLYFSVITFTTVGYGDLHPTMASRLYAGTEALLGAMIFALVVSTLVYIATSIRSTQAA